MRKYVSLKILRSIYFAIFDSYLSYCCIVWAQNFSTIQRVLILQKKAVRIINFQLKNFHTIPLFKQNSIIKFQEKIFLENILFVSKSLNILSPSTFNTWFSFSSDQQLSLIFVLNHINNSFDHAKMNLVYKILEEWFQLFITLIKFLFTTLFVVI